MTDSLLAAFRHDAHKFTGERHAHARDTFAGVPVNQPVPEGADEDAAALSRPRDRHDQTVPNHVTHHRLSLLTGDPVADPSVSVGPSVESEVRPLLAVTDVVTAHERWLTSEVAAVFNESVYHPYTSLKYHTLLVAALLDAYQSGHDFDDLQLVVEPADDIVPCRTIYAGDRFTLALAADPDGRPSARLGSQPSRSWASVWSHLTAHPLATNENRYDMVLDANLRRIQSWSTALQYLDDYRQWRPDR